MLRLCLCGNFRRVLLQFSDMCERHGVQGGDFGKYGSRGEIVACSDDNEEEVDVDVTCVESLS